jgi:undecaprenyl-diphosphatase
MLAAGGYEIAKALHHPAADAPPENWPMVGLGFAVSAVVSFVAVKWLLRYVQTHTFALFGWYRIALAAAILFLIWR